MKYLRFTSYVLLVAFVIQTSSCHKCIAPFISFSLGTNYIEQSPRDIYIFDIIVDGGNQEISSITVYRTINDVSKPCILLATIGTKNKTITITDTVPFNIGYGTLIQYKITATIDCNLQTKEDTSFNVKVIPSPRPLDPFMYYVESTFSPRIYNRFSINGNNYLAWDLGNRAGKLFKNSDFEKDIQDSILAPNPFNSNTVQWGSRNGSKFVRVHSSFDYDLPSAKSIVDAFNNGIPSDLVGFGPGDFIAVNIKNSNHYAIIKIKWIYDDGLANNEDYVYFSYWLAQDY